MNILFVAEKPSTAKYYKNVIDKHKDEFPDNYYFDYVNNVFHYNDNIIRIQKKNDKYYMQGKLEKDLEPLKLNCMDIPEDTFLLYKKTVKRPEIDYSKMDLIISICDPDDRGVLSFFRYVEFNKLKNTKMILTYSFEEYHLYQLLKEKTFIDTEEHIKTMKRALTKKNFSAEYPREYNVLLMRNEFGLNRKEFAQFFEIPYRTVENWESKKSNCPKYLYELMEYKLINELLKEE